MRFIEDLLSMPSGFTPARRAEITRVVAWLFAIIVVFALGGALAAASKQVGTESAIWDLVLQSRLILVRLVFSLVIVIMGYGVSLLLCQAYEHTQLSQRTSYIQPMIFLAVIMGMLIGVLR